MLKNRLFTSVFMMLAMAGMSAAATMTPATPDKDGDCYLISNAAELYGFAAIVNGTNGHDAEPTACGVLTQNITVNENVLTSAGELNTAPAGGFIEWTPIGSFDNPFAGTFDGQGHTISGLYFNNFSADNVGLFGKVSVIEENVSASISNVGIEDSYFRANSAVGGVVGYVEFIALNLENVYNAAVVVGAYEAGGIVGFVALENQTLSMVNVYNVGSINGMDADAGQAGGLVGDFMNDCETSMLTIKNSYNYGNVDGGDPLVGKVEMEEEYDGAVIVTNSFTIGESKFEGKGATRMNPDDFVNGVAFAQLYSAEDGEVWRQYENDAYPTFAAKTGTDAPSPMHVATLHYSETDVEPFAFVEGATTLLPMVSAQGYIVVEWYENSDRQGTSANFISEGVEDYYATVKQIKFVNGCYEIANADALFEFADMVNNQNKTYATACAKLTADIVVNENVLTTASGESNVNANGEYIGDDSDFREWNPIGGKLINGVNQAFKGTFDGQGHTVSGLYKETPIGCSGSSCNNHRYMGLFGYVHPNDGDTVSIKNVGIEDSYFSGNAYIGGIVGYFNNDKSSMIIENSYSMAAIYAANQSGGLVGYYQTDVNLKIENSYSFGNFICNTQCGALVGVNFGTHPVVVNSYYLEGIESGYGTAASSTAFSDGTVAILLHGTDGESVWGQKVETDNHPNFYKGIDGSSNPKTEGPGVIEYPQGETEPSPFTVTLHYGEDSDSTFECYPGIETPLPTEDKNGKTIIGWTTSDDGSGDIITAIPTTATSALALYPKIDEFVPNDDGYYEITTVEQLYRFAEIVNTCEESCNFKAKLEDDITVNENVLKTDGSLNSDAASKFVAWTPIGKNDHSFSGVFDGQGHTISGLYFNEYDEEGLLTTSSVGLFGLVDGSTTSISNVGVKDSYFGTVWGGAGIGGIVGVIDENSIVNIENAYSKATVVGAIGDSYAGGLVGDFWGSSLTITNSYHAGVVEGASGGDDYGFGGLVGENYGTKISITNSFNYGTVQCSDEYCGALIGVDYAETTVTNSYYLASKQVGDYGEFKSASDFENGTVLAALRAGEGGYVWVQAEGDKYPTIDINASTNANTIVLDWASAADSTTLADADYTDSAMVIVKDGKQFYADGAIYEGILSAAQVAAIGDKTLYPISGVKLETVNDKLVATLNGDSQDAVMIPTDVRVDKVVYNRDVATASYKTVMLPFSVPVSAASGFTFYKFRKVDYNDYYKRDVVYVKKVAGQLEANTPYIMIASSSSSQIVFEAEGGFTLNTAGTYETSYDAGSIVWKMKGVYESKVWEKGDEELGFVYGFADQNQDGYKIGDFTKLGDGASIVPMRVYMVAEEKPKAGRPGLTGTAPLARVQDLPEGMAIVIDDSDAEESEEKTLVLNRIKVAPTAVKSDRWFDLRGRALNGKPTTKGTYYHNGQRVIIK